MYRQISVWRRIDSQTAACYRCFERLSDGVVAVQSVDYFRLPLSAAQRAAAGSQLAELFIEEDPIARSGGYPSVMEAIAAHDRDFRDDVATDPRSPSVRRS